MISLIPVQNLKCHGCASSITAKLTDFDFVTHVEVNVSQSTVEVIYEHESNLPLITAALRQLGYPQVGDTNPISSKAKSYVSCAIGKMN